MKYGLKLLAVKNSSDPEWAPFWPNYKLLKVKIKEIQVLQQADAVAESSAEAAPAPGDEEPLRCEPSTIQRSAGEVAFFKALHGELRKTAEFFTSVEVQYVGRRGRVREGLRQLQQGEESSSNLAARGAPAAGDSDDDEEEDGEESTMPALTNLMAACLSLYKELIMLENFAVMAHTAFSKILKKHDKRTGYATRGQFMRNLVNLQSFARYPALKQLLHEVEGMYRAISAMQSSAPAQSLQGASGAAEGPVSPSRPVPTRSDIEEAKVMTMQAKEELDAELQPDHEPSAADGSRAADGRREETRRRTVHAAASGGSAMGLAAFLELAEAAAAAAPVPVPRRAAVAGEGAAAKRARVGHT